MDFWPVLLIKMWFCVLMWAALRMSYCIIKYDLEPPSKYYWHFTFGPLIIFVVSILLFVW